MKPFDFLGGETLLIDKPKEWTSFDVVNKVRHAIRIKKVGHAGTLDPLATGLLILCTGKATKTINDIQGQEKEYEALIKFGATTPSYDAELDEENIQDVSDLNREQILKAMQAFQGEIEQVPPAYSAVKVNGQRAYKAARKGKKLELKSRQVHIYQFDLLENVEPPHTWRTLIRCSKGTYIRSLAHDLGQALGVGAYLTGLIRTRIGDHSLEDAWHLEDLIQEIKSQRDPQRGEAN